MTKKKKFKKETNQRKQKKENNDWDRKKNWKNRNNETTEKINLEVVSLKKFNKIN